MIRKNFRTSITSRLQKNFKPRIAAKIIFYPIIRSQYSRTCPLWNLRWFYPNECSSTAHTVNITASKNTILTIATQCWTCSIDFWQHPTITCACLITSYTISWWNNISSWAVYANIIRITIITIRQTTQIT